MVRLVIIIHITVLSRNIIGGPGTRCRNTLIIIGTTTRTEKKRLCGTFLFGKIKDGDEQHAGARDHSRRGQSQNTGPHPLCHLPRWRTTTRRIHHPQRHGNDEELLVVRGTIISDGWYYCECCHVGIWRRNRLLYLWNYCSFVSFRFVLFLGCYVSCDCLKFNEFRNNKKDPQNQLQIILELGHVLLFSRAPKSQINFYGLFHLFNFSKSRTHTKNLVKVEQR